MNKFICDGPFSDGALQQNMRLCIQLKDLENIRVQRKVSMPESEPVYQLYVICDASTTAYTAVVSLGQKVADCNETKTLTAKTRVARMKLVCSTWKRYY